MFENKIEAENKIYNLNYSVSKSDEGNFVLSVSKEYDNNIVDKSTLVIAPITFESLVEIVETMCRNTVTPTSLREIAEELVVNSMFVE